MSKKVEIIEININMDIDEEIRKKVESLKTDIAVHTKKLLNRAKLKMSKKTIIARERDAQLAKAVKYMEEAYRTFGPDSDKAWVIGKKLLNVAGIEPTPQSLNKFSLQVRKFLTINDKWLLLRRRKCGNAVYRLERFS